MSAEARRAFVALLHRKRLALGLSQEAVGKRVGVHGNTVSKWESARQWPLAAAAQAWADALGVQVVGGSLRELFRGAPACGTEAGWSRHRRAKEEPCSPCESARSEANVGRNRRRKPKPPRPDPRDEFEVRRRDLVEAMKKTA